MRVSPALIAGVTDAVLEEVTAWQNRPLEPTYPIVFLDALMVKMRHEGRVENRAVSVAIGIDLDGRKDVLGLWTSAHEGAKFWLQVRTDLKNRGVQDMLIARVDGVKGFPQAIEALFPQAPVLLCIVHLVRASMHYVSWKERKAVAQDLKTVCRAATEAEAERQLVLACRAMGCALCGDQQSVAPAWDADDSVFRVSGRCPAGDLQEERGAAAEHQPVEGGDDAAAFPSEDLAVKGIYLELRKRIAKWESVQHRKPALNQVRLPWEDRIQAARVR